MGRDLARKWADSAHLRSRLTPYAEEASDSDPSGAQTLLVACAAMADLALPAERIFPLAGVRVPSGDA